MNFWQHLPEQINPNLIEIGSFQIRYYGVMYLVAFGITYLLLKFRIKREGFKYTTDTIQTFFIYTVLGVIIGGRIGYVLFYDFSHYMQEPLSIILPFDFSDGFKYTGLTGMSYHGGFVGVVVSSMLFCRKYRVDFWELADFLSPAIPLGYTFGRLGNFINGELFGRATDAPWGMYFPMDITGQLRHPSQLYEAFFEGIFLFAILWTIRKKHPFKGFHFCLYIAGYAIARFFVEYTREPNPGLGSILNHFTMGQLLSIPMLITAATIMIIKTKSRKACEDNSNL